MTLLQALALWWYGPSPTSVVYDHYLERRGQVAGYRCGVHDTRKLIGQMLMRLYVATAHVDGATAPGLALLAVVQSALTEPFPVEGGCTGKS